MKLSALVLLLALSREAIAADVRDFAPDRPSRSDSPFTVPAGYDQVESDFVNYTDTGDALQALDPTLKHGVTNLLDAEVTIGGYQSQRAGGQVVHSFGDIVVRLKLSLLGDDGGAVAIALIPYAKAPTARAPIGNEHWEGGANLPILISLPYDLGLTVEPEIAVLKNAQNDGSQASFTGVVNLGRKVFGPVSTFVELYAQTYTDHQTPGPTLTFDTGLSWTVTKTLQLDIGANVGLNRSTPGANLYTGIAARF